MEAEVGIEPTDEAFAEPCLTTWLLRLRVEKPSVDSARRARTLFHSGSFCGISGEKFRQNFVSGLGFVLLRGREGGF